MIPGTWYQVSVRTRTAVVTVNKKQESWFRLDFLSGTGTFYTKLSINDSNLLFSSKSQPGFSRCPFSY